MLEYYRKKLPHLIALFSRLHLEKTKRPLTMFQLFKYFAFLDFASVKIWGRPVTGLNYVAWSFGPVPEKLYEDLKQGKTYKSNLYQVVLKDKVVYIYPDKEIPDSNFFSDWEKEEIKRLIEIYAERWVRAEHMLETSHQTIKAWKKAYEKGPGTQINMMDELEDIADEELKALLTERLETFLFFNKT